MDRYMNDTHSLYYNVDHSSMFGSNLSTVFADGPPPLEDSLNDDDHGEFVFSSETDAIGQAVLNKIESKLKRDAETRSAGDEHENSRSGTDIETNPNSSTEKFEAFANFEASNGSTNFGTSEKSDDGAKTGLEVNGFKENIGNNAESDDFSDNEFGDFSAGFSQTANLNKNKPDIDKHCFTAFQNKDEQMGKSMFTSDKQTSSNEGGAKKPNDFQFANFGSFINNEDFKESDWDKKCNDNAVSEEGFGINFHSEKVGNQSDMSNTSDDEFASFEEAEFGAFTTNKDTKTSDINEIRPKPDVIPTKEKDDLTSPKLPPDLTSHETKNADVVEPFQAFTDDTPSETKNGELSPDWTNQTEDTNEFGTFKDNSFNDFASTSDDSFGDFSQSFQTSNNQPQDDEKQTSEMNVFNSDTNKKEAKDDVAASSADDDFGDFADFSNDSFIAFSSDNSRTDNSKASDFSPENNSNPTQNSNEFTAFSEAKSSKKEHKFAADSESTVSQHKQGFQADFGAFSESISSKNKQVSQADFGAYSQSTSSAKSSAQRLSSKQSMGLTKLVSFHACFQDVFVTLRHKVEDLKHAKVPGEKRLNQEKLWENLHSNMGEGALRFSWEQCKTSDKICKALEVSKKHIMVNPNILAMSEGLEIPVFAAGLGILQPSIVPTPPKQKKAKSKKEKGNASEPVSSTPPPSLQTQAVIPEFKTDTAKDNGSDTASLSNSDTASLDLDFFASAPSNVSSNADPTSSNSLYNLEFAFGPVPPGNQTDLAINREREFDAFKPSKPIQDDPLEILKKLDTSKMSSSVVNESRAQLSSRASGIVKTFEDLSFMHSSVLMFPLNKNN